MTHEEVLEALGAYVDGELEPPRRAALEAHLATCAECRGELEALHELDRALGAHPVPDPGSQYWAQFADRVAARTGASAATGGARFYERLTGWLFPHERFAWARAATAVAACTLLLTLGLHGFRTIGTPTGQRLRTALPEAAPPAQDINLPPRGHAESQELEIAEGRERPVERTPPAGPAPAPKAEPEPRADVSSPTGGAEGRVARPAPPARADGSGAPATEELSSRSQIPPQAAVTLEAPSELVAADEPAGAPSSGKAKREIQEGAPPAGPAGGRTPTPGYSGFATAPPAAKGVLDSLAGSILDAHKPKPLPEIASPIRIEGPTGESEAAVESLLARDARLWPRREDPQARSQIEALATDLTHRARDPRLRSRAHAWLEYLVATSSSDADRERWEHMLGSLSEP